MSSISKRNTTDSPAKADCRGVARAREIAADLQRPLAEELEGGPAVEGDGTLLAAFFIAGYSTVLVGREGQEP